MANVTQSLFGFTPQDIQAQRMAELDKRTAAFAQLTPMQQAQASIYRAGSMFGDAAAGALGYEDPQVAQARARQGLLGGLDMNDPESLLKAAQSVQATDPQAALALVNQANTLKGTQADIRDKNYKMEMEQVAYQNRFRALKSQFPDMTDEVAQGLASDEAAFRKSFEDKQAKVSAFGQTLMDAGLAPGSPAYKAQMSRYVENQLKTGSGSGGPKDTESKASGTLQQNLRDTEQMRITAEEAMTLLDSGTPTGSGVGRVIDEAAAMVGKSTPGAQGAAKLNVLAGRLTSSVPRMQGPQSDKDVKMYEKMAGQVGDANLPLATRRAALQTVIELTQKYEELYKKQLEEQSKRAPGDAGPPTRANAGTNTPRGNQPTRSGW